VDSPAYAVEPTMEPLCFVIISDLADMNTVAGWDIKAMTPWPQNSADSAMRGSILVVGIRPPGGKPPKNSFTLWL
jgi:hypothetical protein